MKKVEKLSIGYVGYSEPSTTEEVELEILGLKTAIADAKRRIAVLTQSDKLTLMMQNAAMNQNEKTIEETCDSEKVE